MTTATQPLETYTDPATGNVFTRKTPFDIWTFAGTADAIQAAAAALGAPVAPVDIETSAPVEDGSRLDQLLAQYDAAHAAKSAAEKALKEITDGIKAELQAAAPDGTKINVASPRLSRPLRLNRVESTSVDSARLKAEQPIIYSQYSKASVKWTLAAVGA